MLKIILKSVIWVSLLLLECAYIAHYLSHSDEPCHAGLLGEKEGKGCTK